METQPRSAMAVASLVLGIVALVTSILPIINNLSFLLAILGIVFAIVGLVGISKGKKSGKGLGVDRVPNVGVSVVSPNARRTAIA